MRTKTATVMLALACAISLQVEARLTRIVIISREVVAGGAAFGATGAYEKLTGTAYFEADPRNPHNAVVFDLDKAPRNAAGKVEFSADLVLLRPVDMSKASGTLFFEVNNRGNKIVQTMLNDTPPTANNNNPTTSSDFGNGFLQRRGYVVAWVGWGADIAPGNSRLTVSFPIAVREIKETIGGKPYTLKLKGTTVVSIDPPGKIGALYQHERYLADKAPIKTVERFVSNEQIDW